MTQPNYRIIAYGRQLGIGVAGSRYVTLSAVAKENSSAAPYCVPNELICGELARMLRLPVPPLGIVKGTGGPPLVASLDFNLTGNSLPDVDVAQCVAELPDLSAGLLMFDIWVANLDRHAGNFSVDFFAKPPQMNIFDHSHALFGYVAGQGEVRLNGLIDRLGISWTTNNPIDSGKHRHCLLDAVTSDDHFDKWVDRIQAVPDYFVEEVCRDAGDYGLTSAESAAAAHFLKRRRDRLPDILQAHHAEFTAIKSWGLLP